MRFGKMLFVGAAAAAIVFSLTGCFSDDESLEKFRIREDGSASSMNGRGANLAGGDADLNSVNGGNDNSGVSEWGESNGLNPYDDFGTPIAGLSFQPVYFRFDQSTIDSGEYFKLDQVAAYIMSNPGTGVVIEGNCDAKGSDEYNRALGERRALAAKDYLLQKGISDSRIRTVSYGEEKPAVPEDPAAAKNRRDEFVGVALKK
jgi:peptidoglycan-associated lipoprotein